MTATPPAGAARYRFCRPPDEAEIETRELAGDEAAEAYARELSRAQGCPVVIQRLHGHVDWRYLTEVDERP